MAENVLFLSPRQSDAAVLTPSSEVVSLPASNAQNQEPTKKWRTTGIAAEYVAIDMGSAVACNALALVGHNLSATATIRVRGKATSDVTVAPSIDTTALSAWPSSGKHADADWAHELSLIKWTNSTGYRYWRVDIADAGNTAAYLDIGRLMLGRAYQPTLNFDIDGAIGFVPIDVQEPNGYGQTFTDPRPWAQRQFDLMFSAADADDAHDGAMELSRLRGNAGDVVVCLDPAETTRFHRWSLQGLFAGRAQYKPVPFFNNSKMMWGFAVSLIEKL